MKYLIAIALVILVAGCMEQQAPAAKTESNCSDTGCPVDISPPSSTTSTLSQPKCGDGILEAPEECDQNFPCASGYCQQCKCVIPQQDEIVSDCSAECEKNGYKNASIEADGNCTYNFGQDNPCQFRCAYRKIFPMAEAGKVCCCRELKYAACKKNQAGGCDCPTEDKVALFCKDLRPKLTVQNTTQNTAQNATTNATE